jgi:DNA polymerase-3 subunit delta'
MAMEPLEVYGQTEVKARIERALGASLSANSLLFEGPYGVGKERMAFWLARLLLCEAGRSCGRCLPCGKVLRLTHPDVRWMVPAPGEDSGAGDGDGEGSERQSEREKFLTAAMEKKREEPFFVPRSQRQLGHSADSMRQLIAWCAKRPFEAERKIVIIRDADSMAPGIANLFLKLLEEPPRDTVLILTSAMPHRLLPTVLSRCMRFRFPSVGENTIAEALVAYRGLSRERASLLSKLAQGSLLRAIDLADGQEGGREDALRLFGLAATGKAAQCYDAVLASARAGGEPLERILSFMILVTRDLLVRAEGGGEDRLVNIDLIDKMKKLEGKWDRGRMGELILELERIRDDLRYHVNQEVALWKALDAVMACLHDGASPRETADPGHRSRAEKNN